MFSKTSIVAAVAGALALVSAASAETSGVKTVVTYTGNHNPPTLVQVVSSPARTAPYALTGEQSVRQAPRYEVIWVGQRFAGLRAVN